MIFTEIVELPKDEVVRFKGIIDMTNELCPPIWDTVEAVSVDFGYGWEIDINICNGEPSPYVDAVLFHDGCEVYTWEITDSVLGEWQVVLGGDINRAFRLEIFPEGTL